jgi:AAA-like domain
MKQLVSTEEPIRLSSMMDFKLSRMGLVNFIGSKTIPSCELYRVYFRERLA